MATEERRWEKSTNKIKRNSHNNKIKYARITFFHFFFFINDTVFRNTNLFPPFYRADVLCMCGAVAVIALIFRTGSVGVSGWKLCEGEALGPLFRVGRQLCWRRRRFLHPPKPQMTVRAQKLFWAAKRACRFQLVNQTLQNLGQKKFWLSVSSHVIEIISSSFTLPNTHTLSIPPIS